jgi:hypothetical protein
MKEEGRRKGDERVRGKSIAWARCLAKWERLFRWCTTVL